MQHVMMCHDVQGESWFLGWENTVVVLSSVSLRDGRDVFCATVDGRDRNVFRARYDFQIKNNFFMAAALLQFWVTWLAISERDVLDFGCTS